MTKPLLRPYMPELNSLRGLACLAVLFFHGLWWYVPANATGAEGFIHNWMGEWHRGVGMFFVLSGFLITGILRDSKERPDYYSRFYKRRALRILPAYYMILILLAAYGQGITRGFLGLSAIYLANMAPMLGVVMGYGPLWTLAVEEQFYLFWPMLVRRFPNRTIAFVSVGLFVNSVVLVLGLHSSSPKETFPIWFAAHGLAVGDLLALYMRSRWASRSNVRNLGAGLLLVGSIAVYLSHLTEFRPQVRMAFQGGWDLIFAAVLLFALLLGSSRFEALARPRWLQFFGEISYGLYLVHVLVFMLYRRIFHRANTLGPLLLQFAVCATVSVALATLSRFTVEEWFLSLKDKPLRISKDAVNSEEFEELTPVSEAQ